jgi:hypothetical protein
MWQQVAGEVDDLGRRTCHYRIFFGQNRRIRGNQIRTITLALDGSIRNCKLIIVFFRVM